ncbi:MAG: hypothetical protein M3R43_02795 [Acidobacteriota bacterium]|nr:hypothetical protein [Acidobacteriota bacterium]
MNFARQRDGLWLCYPERVLMRTLFAISMVALAMLLWASISIVRHVRQARRDGMLLDSQDVATNVRSDGDLGPHHSTAPPPPPPASAQDPMDWSYFNKASSDSNDSRNVRPDKPENASG